MELTVARAASQHGRTERFVQLALQRGDLPGLRRVGRATVFDDVAATAWSRSLARGRRWSPEVASAALDMLSHGRTERLSSSERSRLRARLRSMSAQEIAHAAGGLGRGWGRYRVSRIPGLDRVGPSRVDQSELGILPGRAWMTFAQTEDLDAFELETDSLLDADGNLGMVERPSVDDRIARVLLDTYLLGDVRLSAAAATELEARAHAL